MVGAAELEASLIRIRAECRDPVAGVFGPQSAIWTVSREQAVLLGGGRASLLQLAHPYVGEAVAASAEAVTNPLGRFKRTFEAVYAMVFGHLDDVLASARRVHQVHTHVRGALPAAGPFAEGHRYAANEPAALTWVLATLVDGSVQALRTLDRPLPAGFEERFWQDAVQLGALFGLRPADLPADWAAFRRYFDGVVASDLLTVTPRAAEVGRRLLYPPSAGALEPMWAAYRAVTASLLPPRLRAPFGLRWGRREAALARASILALTAADRAAPRRLAWVPPYREALARLHRGGRPVDRVGRAVEAGLLAVLLRPPSGAVR